MKNYRTAVPAAAALVVVLLAAFAMRPRPAPASPPMPADGVARTTPRQLAGMLARNEAIVLDVRDADAYIAGHIEGALHIPLTYIAGEVPYLRKGKPVVTYCT